ncbi:ThuA domain-containing protein [Sphingomonas sp. So64.6b]|uniref:ThuA domain-containing protein n=1 Tax=Sphingomonas sp. So64.6b TaxID=2997354 RepID=UPI001FCECFCC|nr:ThuA domain-containing protein [Sphingomonas sp. So64.6b]
MRYLRCLLLILVGGVALTGSAAWAKEVGAKEAGAKEAPRVLIFSKSTGWRHMSITPGVAALKALGARAGMTMIASEDPDIFSTDGLKDVKAIILLSDTSARDAASEWFTDTRREAFEAFVHRGGGVVGIHAAADSHYNWPWYGRMIGARFQRHPQGTPEGTITVVDPRHPAMKGLAPVTRHVDEWYYFEDYNPRLHLLATIDPASIGEADVNPNPVAWCQEFEGGRIFYTAMGHTDESYRDPWFVKQIENGLNWVLKR